MEASLQYRNMTLSEALSMLQFLLDVAVANYEAMPTDQIQMESRISDLYWLGDDMSFGASRIAGALGPLFGITVPMREWRNAISPVRRKTVADLCNFLATHATVPVIPAPSFLGRPCRAAGTFQAIQQMLAQRGVDTTDLRPSSPLEDFTTLGFPKIWSDLIRITPSVGLRMRSSPPPDILFILLDVPFFFLTIIGGLMCQTAPSIGIPLATGSFLAFALVWRLSEKCAMPARQVFFNGLTTFRDLCKFMVDANTTDLSCPNKD